VEVGTINVNFTGRGGFDLVDTFALATFTVDGVNKLYSLNLTTAAAIFIVNLSSNIRDIAIPTNPVGYSISESNMFQTFNPTRANSTIDKPVTGLAAGETLGGIDFRPLNGQLYGIAINGTMAKLYTFNLSTGAATSLGAGFTIGAATAFGFDFNPTVDRIRFITNTGQNFRLNPIDGTVAFTDGNLNPGTPGISAAAYTNNFAGATTTVLFDLDMTKLYRQDPPNTGTLVELGTLGITADSQNGFDIGGTSNTAFAILSTGTTTKIYTINTSTGNATPTIDFPNKVKGLAIGLGF
jgi:hypothetical protein